MALFDANDLLATLGGQNLSSNTPYQTLQDYHSHGQSLLDQQMPNLMTSPWQGVSYALGKFLGRNEQDSVNNVEKQTVMNGLDKYMFGGQQQPQGGQPQGAPMTQQPQAPQQLQQPQSPQPQAPPGAVAPNQTAVPNAADKVVVKPASGNSPYIIPAPEAAQGLPNGDKVIATIDAQGKETPVGAQPGAPQAAPQAGPPGMPGQQSPQANAQPGINVGQSPPGMNSPNAQNPDFMSNLRHSFPPAAPPVSEDEAKFLFNLPPETRQQYMQQRQDRYTPYTVDTPFGKYWQMRDGSGREGFYSIPQIKSTKLGEGFEPNQVISQDANTGKINSQLLLPGSEAGAGGTGAGSGLDQALNLRTEVAKNTAQNEAIKAGATSTAKGQVEFNQKSLGDIANTLPENQKVLRDVQTLKSIESLPSTADISSGPYAESILNWKKAVNEFLPGAFDTEKINSAEGVNKIAPVIASGLARQLTNRPTQYDFKTFLENATPNLSQTPAGRHLIEDMYEAQTNEQIYRGQLAADTLAKGGSVVDFNNKMNEWYDQHPIKLEWNGKQLAFTGKHYDPNDPSSLVSASGTNTTQKPAAIDWDSKPDNTRRRNKTTGGIEVKQNGQWVPE